MARTANTEHLTSSPQGLSLPKTVLVNESAQEKRLERRMNVLDVSRRIVHIHSTKFASPLW